MAAFAANLSHHDFEVGGRIFPGEEGAADCGDLPFDEEDPHGNRDRIRGAISKILERNAVPIVLGGDDSVPIPMFEAYAGRGDFSILQIDAHIDWRDEVQGERFGLSSTMRRASENASRRSASSRWGNAALGSRSEGRVRRRPGLGRSTSSPPARSIANGVAGALRHLPSSARVIVSLDVDGMDPLRHARRHRPRAPAAWATGT